MEQKEPLGHIGLSVFNSEKVWINWLDVDHKKIPIPAIGEEYYTRDELPPRREGTRGGIGIVLCGISTGEYIGGIDLDGCMVGGVLLPWAEEIVEEVGSYSEISPSGTGVKIFFKLDDKGTKVKLHRKQVQWTKHSSQAKSWGIECYVSGGRFFTVTERVYGNHRMVEAVSAKKLKWVNERMVAFDAVGRAQRGVIKAIGYMKNDDLTWEDWNVKGMALFNATWGSPAGLEAWVSFSMKSLKYDEVETLGRWEHWKRSPGEYVGASDVIRWAKEGGYEPDDDIADDLGCKEQVEALNLRWAHLLIGRKAYILDETIKEGRLYSLVNVDSWISMLTGFSPVFGKKNEALHDIWLKSKYRRKFDGVVLAPPASLPAPPNYYNIYKGWACTPTRGSWDLFKKHLFYIVCSGNREHWEYLIRWLASKFQYPGKKIGVAIVLIGGKGAGKTIVADYLKKIFGPHFVRVSHHDHFLGKFNFHLEQALLVNAEEAFWAGDKKAEGALKDMITGDSIMIEPKGVDIYPARNLFDLVITSNNDWVVPASTDERRYYVLDVSNEKVGQFAYFRDLVEEMEDSGPAAMLFDLLAVDLTGFEPRRVPRTDAMFRQKHMGMGSHDSYIYYLANEGRVPQMNGGVVVKKVLYDRYMDYVADRKLGRPVIDEIFFKLLIKLGCDKAKQRIDGKTARVVRFPPLVDFRAALDRHFDYAIDWDDQVNWTGAEQGPGPDGRKNLDFEP